MITYMKLMTGGVKHHLVAADRSSSDSTLCGCTVTRSHSWKSITRLEGDECEHCAEIAFGGTPIGAGSSTTSTSRR